MDRLLVLEVNELPKRVLDWWIDRAPDGALAGLVDRGTMSVTVLDEELPRDLYPSQSWASLNTGVPWTKHGVFWYGDPKPDDYPLYWQHAADHGRRVGVLGTVHSSPLVVQSTRPGVVFALPDCFAGDTDALPAALAPIQELNIRLTRDAARVASLRPSPADAAGVVALARHGVRPATWARLADLAARVGTRRWNTERLRAGQSVLLADVFERQVRRHDPDLAVLFVNHVAATMHRYWGATFPEDWPADRRPYDQAWRDRYADELPYAMATLDRIVERLVALAERTGRELVVTTSMGQKADLDLDTTRTHQAVVRDVGRFLTACGVDDVEETLPAMVPQVTARFADPAAADRAEQRLRTALGDAAAETMLNDTTLTLTAHLRCRADAVEIDGRWIEPDQAGVTIERIRDHRSGRHDPRGLLVSSARHDWPAEVDAFRVAPTILDLLGVSRLPHHLDPLG